MNCIYVFPYIKFRLTDFPLRTRVHYYVSKAVSLGTRYTVAVHCQMQYYIMNAFFNNKI